MAILHSFHDWWGYVAIVANGLLGAAALLAWRVPKIRGRWLWVSIIAAEVAMLVQVLTGVVLVASGDYRIARFHMFYGFIAFLTVGLAYQYRSQMRGRREMLYGLTGLFLMGLGIRAILQVG